MTGISYELAKELKDAGFPQRVWGGSLVWDVDNWLIASAFVDIDLATVLVQPTLSELIEACGEDYGFGTLYRIGHKGDFGYHAETNIEPEIRTAGSTPEEAVARLWLALNA